MVYEFNHQSKDFSVGSEIYAAICGVHEYDLGLIIIVTLPYSFLCCK